MTERLREIDRLKQELFAHISHELRTPLTSVREAGGLLRDEVPGPLNAKQLRLVDIIRLNTERMLTLVNQILELARLRGGMLALERRRVDVDALVGRALEALRPQAEANGVTLAREDGTASAGTVVGDEERLFQVVLNLVANAIKFTPPGGAVRVCVGPRADGVDIAVEDTGRGIPTAAVGHVFERYWQARPESGGTGLGLAIVKGVVDAHGGEVRVESVEGRGSCFTVHLPREMRAA
jgi:signal transduction histidine kinase